jgi:hypothetical protein
MQRDSSNDDLSYLYDENDPTKPKPTGTAANATPPATGTAAPPAFDPKQQVGHDGSVNGWNREQYRDAWMSSGVNSVGAAKDWLSAHGGEWLADNGTVRTPFGEVLDMGINAKGSAAGNGQLRAGWGGTGGGPSEPAPVTSGNGFGNGAPGVGGGAAGAPGGAGAGGGQYDALRQQLIQSLMDRSKQSLAVTANDPTIRAQSEPFSAAQDRLARDQIANAAESGGPVQNIEGATRMANEQAATNTGQFTSQLLSREIDSRRQEIQAALTGMQGYISDQDRMALERELGYLNDATQRFGIQTGADTSRYNADSSAASSRYSADSSARTAQRGQDIGNDNFYADLGLRSEDRGAYWDAVRRGLI